MRSTPFKTVLHDCARSQNVDPLSGSFTQEYAGELAESINSWLQELWTQEWWPFLIKTEQRTFRPVYDLDATYAEGDEVFLNNQYWRSMVDGNTAVAIPDTSDAVAVGSVVVVLADEVVFSSSTALVRVQVSGSYDVRVTYDGTAPVAGSVGEVLAAGSIHVFSLSGGQALQFVAESSASSLQVTQWADSPGFNSALWREVLSITPDQVAGYVWDPYIAWEQDGETLVPEDGIDLDNFIFYSSPVVESWARPVRDLREDEVGIHVAAARYPAEPWIRFRPQPPRFTATLYVATETYAKGDATYDATTGECYRSLVAGNLGNAVTNATKWEKMLFPAVFMPVLRLYARAERLGKEEKYDSEQIYMTRANQLVEKLSADFYEQGSRTTRARVRM